MATRRVRKVTEAEFSRLLSASRPVLAAFLPPQFDAVGEDARAMLARLSERFAEYVVVVEVEPEQGGRAADLYASDVSEAVWLFAEGQTKGCVVGGGGEQSLAGLIEQLISR